MKKVKTNPNIVTAEWVSELTGFEYQTICRMARKRKIPGAYKIKPGRFHWKFKRDRVLQWFESIQS
jgi:predicted DNA-binding transcriptional regulator AlpA